MSEQDAKGETITVTGSLIGRKEVDSPSPVSVVDKQRLESAGITNVGDVLQKIPAQGNAVNAQNNNGGDGSVRIDLRSLGTNRTLVLMNGRRVVASGLGADDSVDFGTIPLAMIDRIEVLKDGASAIYGADAVAGVVNIITRQNFNGTEASAYAATSRSGDGTNYDLSFVTGHSSAKGNIMFAGGYQTQESIMAGDRDFSKQTYSYNYACNEYMVSEGACSKVTASSRVLSGSGSTLGGRINTQPGGAPAINVPGCTSRFCTADGNGGFRNFVDATADSFGDRYNFQPLNYLLTPSQRINLFSNGGYEFTKNIKAFFEAQFNNRNSTQQLAAEPVTLQTTHTPISKDSMYNQVLQQDVVEFSRRFNEFGPRVAEQDVNTSRLVVGLAGSLPEELPVIQNWKWEISYNYGRTDSTDTHQGNLIVSHLKNALGPSFMDPFAGPTCGTPTARIDGCVPLSILDPNTVTPEMKNYLAFTSITSGYNQQQMAQATASGRLVELPNHGDISAAIGVDYRGTEGGNTPDALTSTGDTTGNVIQATQGGYHAYEAFAEVSAVPVSGLDYLKWLEIDAAARAYKYNTFGSGVTGKLSVLARTDYGIAVRGTVGNAFRAPSVSELFAGKFDSFQLLEDPCDTTPPSADNQLVLKGTVADKCMNQGVPNDASFSLSQQRAKLDGNTKLKAEKAVIVTTGVVYEPLAGLDFTLDYWNYKIDQAIQTIPVSTILSQCYDGGLDEFCQLVVRDGKSKQIDYIYDQIRNVGQVSTSGLDFSAAYQWRYKDIGTFRHAIEGTYLFKYNLDTGVADPLTGKETIIHGRGFYDLGVQPTVKANLFTSWIHPSGLSAGLNVRFVNGFQECDGNDCQNPLNGRRRVGRYYNNDLYAGYALKGPGGTTHISLGVNNVFDNTPPLIYNGSALNADESAYDFMGRFAYVRLGHEF
jgi:iron complex outermembrane receptor protein